MSSRKPVSEMRQMMAPFHHAPKSRAEYCWSQADKDNLRKMVAEGRNYSEIATQLGRTRAACSAMYNLMTKRNV
jgi:hypothetical protein